MIFVTLGTQDKSFERLLRDIQKQIDLGNIKEKVVVQAGFTKFDSKDMEIFDLIPMDDFDKLIEDIQEIYISNNYLDLFSWLIDRAFLISPSLKYQANQSRTRKNRSLLLKTLYDVNPKAVIKCFCKNLHRAEDLERIKNND